MKLDLITAPTGPNTLPAEEERTMQLPLYRVLLHNDDVNSMDHVVLSLMTVFSFNQQTAGRIMLEAHRSGVALCTVEPLEHAELHRDRLHSLLLTASIEPE